MLLSLILKGIIFVPPSLDCEISHLALDSRQVQKNSLFIALKGNNTDGKHFLAQAKANGAVAALIEGEAAVESNHYPWPVFAIPQLAQRLAEIAANFYGHPAKKLKLIGVTGTNGKTSCTHFIAQLLNAVNIPCRVIGTLGYGQTTQLKTTALTTPDALSLQSILAEFVQQGVQVVAMEVSSHSIAQYRIANLDFEVVVFTNLSQDHLDYHGTMENYAATKYQFLATTNSKYRVININDTYGKKWFGQLQQNMSCYAYALGELLATPQHIYATNISSTLKGMAARIHTPWGAAEINLPLIGQFNVSNTLAAITCINLLGIPFNNIITQLPHLQCVPGRMQMLAYANQPLVVIDYAHTPDALAKALQSLRPHVNGKLICVFGCGGNRDRAKRAQMAAVAEENADKVIVTTDNPRQESAQAIVNDIILGFKSVDKVYIELDREQAIYKSFQLATNQDIILIAGKGAERYQQIGTNKLPFSDAEKVLHIIKNKLMATMD